MQRILSRTFLISSYLVAKAFLARELGGERKTGVAGNCHPESPWMLTSKKEQNNDKTVCK